VHGRRSLPQVEAVLRIATSLVVFAVSAEPLLFAQASATVTLSATVLPAPLSAPNSASLELLGAPQGSSAAAGVYLLAAAHGEAIPVSRRSATGSGWAQVPPTGLPPAATLSAQAAKQDGRPETPPTVRITVAYTAN
jgi:hypothetical protein